MAVLKELDRVLSGKVISRTDGSFHRNSHPTSNMDNYPPSALQKGVELRFQISGILLSLYKSEFLSGNKISFNEKDGLEGTLTIENINKKILSPKLYALKDMVLAGENNYRFSSPLQTLLWGYIDGKFKEGDNPLKNYQDALEFVKPIWGNMKGPRWDKFDEVTSRLNLPELLYYYDKNNISGGHYRGNKKTNKEVFESGSGNCYDVSEFNTFCLSKAGYNTNLIWVETGLGDHIIAGFKDKGKIYILDKMGSRHKFLGPFDSYSKIPYDVIKFLQ